MASHAGPAMTWYSFSRSIALCLRHISVGSSEEALACKLVHACGCAARDGNMVSAHSHRHDGHAQKTDKYACMHVHASVHMHYVPTPLSGASVYENPVPRCTSAKYMTPHKTCFISHTYPLARHTHRLTSLPHHTQELTHARRSTRGHTIVTHCALLL
jgi:hypothetical protein